MVRFEFPLGEIMTLGPLIALNILPKPKIDPVGITGKERWNAQGLEGKGFMVINESLAQGLSHRLGKYRSRIVKL